MQHEGLQIIFVHLSHCGILSSYTDKACCLRTPGHYLNPCWLIKSKVQWHIHLRAITQEVSQQSVNKNALKIIYLKFHSNLLGVNELNDIHYAPIDMHARINAKLCEWNGPKLLLSPVLYFFRQLILFMAQFIFNDINRYFFLAFNTNQFFQ